MKFEALVIDGDNICWKNYFANSELSHNGQKTGAIFGTVRSILAYHKRFNPEFMIVTWTQSNEKRKSVYPEYKAHRSKEDRSDYFIQQDVVEDLLSSMGILQGKIKGFEADDLMANISDELSSNNYRVVIISSDKDMLQMVNPNIFVLRNDKLYDKLLVFEEFGCTPKDIPLWLAIKGDKSDNIDGVRGIGPKKLARLFKDYGSGLEHHIMNGLMSETTDSELKKLIDEKAKIALNLKIIRLNPKEINPLHNTILTNQDSTTAMRILEKYGMHSIIKDVAEYIDGNKIE